MRVNMVLAAAAVIGLAGPAQAALQLYTFSGTAGVSFSATPIAALQQFQGASVVGAFLIDTAPALLQVGGPVGGQGESARLNGAILSGQIDLFGTNGPVSLLRTGNDPGNIFTVNNGGVGGNPNNRIDQMGYSTGAGFAGGTLFTPYDLFGGILPPDLFLGSLFFGRTLQGPFDNPPALITDVTTRDFAGALTGPVGNPLLMSLVFRQGDPRINGTLTGLPLQSVAVGNIQLRIINLEAPSVPEPASWAMLIAGFGLVGATLRRRRALAA
jgi:PEP-CTERM motif